MFVLSIIMPVDTQIHRGPDKTNGIKIESLRAVRLKE